MQPLIYLNQIDLGPFGYIVFIILVAILAVILLTLLLMKLPNLKYSVNEFKRKRNQQAAKKTPRTDEESVVSIFNFNELKKEVKGLKESQDVLGERISSMHRVLGEMQVEMRSLRLASGVQNNRTKQTEKDILDADRSPARNTRDRQSYLNDSDDHAGASKQREAYSDITELYNSSRSDQECRAKFREKYRPFFINVTNDVNRRRNENLPADFRKESDGSYLAVSLDSSDKAIVFPNFTLVIVDAVYGPGAIGEVFDCPNFDRRFSYPNIRVARPATFKLKVGDSWGLTKKGELELGQAHDA